MNLPPCDNPKRLTWELRRLVGSHVDDAAQEAWLAHLEGRNPISAVKVYHNRNVRERGRMGVIVIRHGQDMAVNDLGFISDIPAARGLTSCAFTYRRSVAQWNDKTIIVTEKRMDPIGRAVARQSFYSIDRDATAVARQSARTAVAIRNAAYATATGHDPVSENQSVPPERLRLMATDEIWDLFSARRTKILLDELIVRHLPLVHKLAIRMSMRLRGRVEVDELFSDGCLGLRDAICKYNKAMGVKFETYGSTRITGQILDEIRNRDWVPRKVRSSGETPFVTKSIASENRSDGEQSRSTEPEDMDAGVAFESIGSDEEFARMIRPLHGLHREIVLKYYKGGLKNKAIGESIGLTESRVSQLHGEALRILRSVHAVAA